MMEATTGFEPVSQGFAVPCLTTWLRRRCSVDYRWDTLKRQRGSGFIALTISGVGLWCCEHGLSPLAEKSARNPSINQEPFSAVVLCRPPPFLCCGGFVRLIRL